MVFFLVVVHASCSLIFRFIEQRRGFLLLFCLFVFSYWAGWRMEGSWDQSVHSFSLNSQDTLLWTWYCVVHGPLCARTAQMDASVTSPSPLARVVVFLANEKINEWEKMTLPGNGKEQSVKLRSVCSSAGEVATLEWVAAYLTEECLLASWLSIKILRNPRLTLQGQGCHAAAAGWRPLPGGHLIHKDANYSFFSLQPPKQLPRLFGAQCGVGQSGLFM